VVIHGQSNAQSGTVNCSMEAEIAIPSKCLTVVQPNSANPIQPGTTVPATFYWWTVAVRSYYATAFVSSALTAALFEAVPDTSAKLQLVDRYCRVDGGRRSSRASRRNEAEFPIPAGAQVVERIHSRAHVGRHGLHRHLQLPRHRGQR
jgi:hypothetical protein